MNVYLFGFQKKRNSTKQPLLADGTRFSDVQLKEETSVLNPVLLFNPSSAGMPNPFNPNFFTYAFIQQFNRFYFVSDWRWLNGIWECSLAVDVLASYKASIGTTSAYVLRSASARDGNVCDTLYPCKAGMTYNNDFFSMALSQTGLYVVGIINNSSYATDGAVTYYMMTTAQLGQLKSFLLSDSFLSLAGMGSFTDIPQDFIKSYFDPFQYIVSCRFFPIDYTVATKQATDVTSIEIGWWTMSLNTKRMPSGYYNDIQTNDVTAGTHPQASSRGAYLNHAPYTERIMIHPMLGTIPLDSNKIDAGDTLRVSTRVDFTTGEALTYVGDVTKNITLYTQAYMFAVNVQLAQISQDMFSMSRNAIDTISGAVTGAVLGGLPGAIAGAASGILNTIEASQPILSSSGSNGNRAVYHVPVYLQAWYRSIVDEDNADRGRPLCAVRTLNTLSGYILCSEAHADFSCYDAERSDIEGYLNSGFFYE